MEGTDGSVVNNVPTPTLRSVRTSLAALRQTSPYTQPSPSATAQRAYGDGGPRYARGMQATIFFCYIFIAKKSKKIFKIYCKLAFVMVKSTQESMRLLKGVGNFHQKRNLLIEYLSKRTTFDRRIRSCRHICSSTPPAGSSSHISIYNLPFGAH